jgi:predicted nuclease of predicted toxin-antitoxin system
MRVLLDEHLDRRLKPMFDSRFEVVTVHEHG